LRKWRSVRASSKGKL